MKITNRYGAPQTLVNLMRRDPYSRGASHISVTQLIDAPRVRVLREKHDHEIEADVSDSLWALVGRALHHVVERGAMDDHVAEQRLFADVGGWRLSGAIDLQQIGGDRVVIGDYKFTSAWAATNDKPEWERQLNVYSWLARQAKQLETERLEVYALIRDWNRRDAKIKSGYPRAPILTVPIKLWTADEQDAYVRDRIRRHQEAWAAHEWGEQLPLCNEEERWVRRSQWAVESPGRARAVRVFDTEEAAIAFVANGDTDGDDQTVRTLSVVHRAGQPVRCLSFCPCAKFCTQHQAYLKTIGKAE